jgi:hypothetical protein
MADFGISGDLREAAPTPAWGVRETTQVEKRFFTIRSAIAPTAVCRDA